jgi:hypothetical protein
VKLSEQTAAHLPQERHILAIKFFNELCAVTDSFDLIAEHYGATTLGNLLYLQGAVLKGGFIECTPDEFDRLDDILNTTPGWQTWLAYIVRVK